MKKKILLVVDRPNWAFHNIANQIYKYYKNKHIIKIVFIKGSKEKFDQIKANSFDLIFFFHWSLTVKKETGLLNKLLNRKLLFEDYELRLRYRKIDYSKVITGVHAVHDFDNGESTPENYKRPPPNLIRFLKKFKSLNAVSNRLYLLFKDNGLENIVCTENGVDTQNFKPLKNININGNLIIGCSGTKKRDKKEGITEFIEPLKKISGIDLKLAIPQDGNYVKPSMMPSFLNSIDLYVLMSSSEGFPLKALEACSCGRPIISTKVSGVEDIVVNGKNGFLINRDHDELIKKVKFLKKNRKLLISMGKKNREIIVNSWSWKKKIKNWIKFIDANL